MHQSQISISKEDLTIIVTLCKSKLTKKNKIKKDLKPFWFKHSLQPTNIYYSHFVISCTSCDSIAHITRLFYSRRKSQLPVSRLTAVTLEAVETLNPGPPNRSILYKSSMLFIYLAEPDEARSCSTNSLVIDY